MLLHLKGSTAADSWFYSTRQHNYWGEIYIETK